MTTRDYEAPGITVHWDSSLCTHSAVCLNALPTVFDTGKRPWVTIDGATAQEIHAAVALCPSGALTSTLSAANTNSDTNTPADGAVTSPGGVTLTLRPNGPLVVDGDIELLAADGEPLETGAKVFLCRCGASGRKPFCDGTHAKVGFEG